MLKKVLSIAGSDSSGGAGIQADIKTMIANKVYAMTAITALTAQNTMGVKKISEVSEEFLEAQIDAVCEDIFPDAVKIGMIPSAKQVEVIAKKLKEYNTENIVIDPVMVATSGSVLSENEAVEKMKECLFEMATLLTPNIPEAEALLKMHIEEEKDMEKAAKTLGDTYKCAVLLKGGHGKNDANDLLYDNGVYTWFYGKRIENKNTHGTGCTLSSAIASNLANGYSVKESVQKAKDYISKALEDMLDLGHGSGPINHGFMIK